LEEEEAGDPQKEMLQDQKLRQVDHEESRLMRTQNAVWIANEHKIWVGQVQPG
jgi:hypothetical protein